MTCREAFVGDVGDASQVPGFFSNLKRWRRHHILCREEHKDNDGQSQDQVPTQDLCPTEGRSPGQGRDIHYAVRSRLDA